MANPCECTTTIHGTPEAIIAIRQIVETDDQRIINLRPLPLDCDVDLIVEKWGIPRGDSDLEIVDERPDSVVYRYETPWGPFIDGFWEHVTQTHPVSVLCSYNEDNMEFMGVGAYDAGKTVYRWEGDHPEDETGEDPADRIWSVLDRYEYEAEEALGWISHGVVVK